MKNLKTYLSILFVSCFLISNIVSAKQCALPFGLSMTGAITIFPITYILSDVFSEVYGYKWSRITCYTAFFMNLLMVIVFQIAIALPGAPYWEGQEAFKATLGSTPRILLASLAAYVFGDFVNDKVFAKMKAKHKNEIKGFSARAILSSLIGEICDSLVFMPLAFWGQIPPKQLVIMGATQTALKVAYEILVVPLTRICAKKVQEKENMNA